jgi:hypothetical protein
MDPKKVAAALDALLAGDNEACAQILKDMIAQAAAGGAPAPEGGGTDDAALADNAEPPPAADDQKVAASVGAYLRSLTGAKTDAEASQVFSTVCQQIRSFGEDRAAFELTERRTLIAELVKCGAETPATAWSGDPEKLKPCKRLSDEPIGELRDRVKALSALPPRSLTPPESGGGTAEIKLSKVEQEYCTKHSLTPEQFAARKAGVVRKAK